MGDIKEELSVPSILERNLSEKEGHLLIGYSIVIAIMVSEIIKIIF